MKSRFLLSFFVLLSSAVFLSGCSLSLSKKTGAISIEASPSSEIFLNGESIGKTPVAEKTVDAKTYTVRIVPEDTTKVPYETNIKVEPSLKTELKWNSGDTADASSGTLYEMEKLSDSSKTELSIVTSPDNAVIIVDDKPKGISPTLVNDLSEGSHSIKISAPGYIEMTTTTLLTKGYRTTITLKLARETLVTFPSQSTATASATQATPTATPTSTKSTATPKPTATPIAQTATKSSTPKPTAEEIEPPYVVVQETSTGWLRVRAEASGAAEEVAKLDVGEKVPYFETVNGWHKVEYETGKEGWVSGQYATIVK
ncbi:MAG: hypothetical protein UX04_C0002G0170 [Microgenomates group bacterium GW2011_GWF2_45_18]|nr:MAG: hypothetical protein UW18_C0005G0003 [Microgenomates group bacterium GW2011_GWF1_44_10]KKU02027.1 MAG: hypothetical protein UX04_C0002G0170 [Microgenomates group bacterium GW2011_GWF2_45_18]OGJ41210.1 MAG: hypothetical protein A2378_01025 [Candidatus Pacebacteria bacterium RIFOXYB1_FULL_44_10]HAU98988.1 hypothetical protein [Candidatus Paceibacterota bacterium]HAX01298.1 hypothetical protein [Candidatus Paceibacterota bacterium]